MATTSSTMNPSYDPAFTVPCTAAYEYITPQAAKEMLEINAQNRKLMKGAVLRLNGVLGRQEWRYDSTDAIGLDKDGAVVNGQHRLTSICQSDSLQGVWCLVTRGVRPEIVQVIDQGMGRNLQQTLAMQGVDKAPGVASAIDYLYRMINRLEKKSSMENKASVPQLLELLAEHRLIADSLEIAKDVGDEYRQLNLGAWAAYHYAFSVVNGELADDFYTQLATGVDIADTNPVGVLRERFNKDNSQAVPKLRLRKWQAATFLVTAWESTVAGETLPAKAFAKAPQTQTQVPSVTGVDFLGTVEEEADE